MLEQGAGFSAGAGELSFTSFKPRFKLETGASYVFPTINRAYNRTVDYGVGSRRNASSMGLQYVRKVASCCQNKWLTKNICHFSSRLQLCVGMGATLPDAAKGLKSEPPTLGRMSSYHCSLLLRERMACLTETLMLTAVVAGWPPS